MESLADGNVLYSGLLQISSIDVRSLFRTWRSSSGPASPHTEDYISLSLTKRDDEYLGPHPESRLMREDDDLGEGDDDFAEYTSAKTRIALGKRAKKAEADKVREEMQDLIADAEDVDEETQEWEQAQFRRSGLWPDDTLSTPAAALVRSKFLLQPKYPV